VGIAFGRDNLNMRMASVEVECMRVSILLLIAIGLVPAVYAADNSATDGRARHINKRCIRISMVKGDTTETIDDASLQARVRRAWFPGNDKPKESVTVSFTLNKDARTEVQII
jgi:hypothetical protein